MTLAWDAPADLGGAPVVCYTVDRAPDGVIESPCDATGFNGGFCYMTPPPLIRYVSGEPRVVELLDSLNIAPPLIRPGWSFVDSLYWRLGVRPAWPQQRLFCAAVRPHSSGQ